MTFEQIISIVEVCLTVIGLVLVVFGWIVPHNQNIKLENRRKKEDLVFRKIQWEKDHIDAQIAEFYGPISDLLQEQDIIFERILYMLGRRHIFSKSQTSIKDLPENEQKIWIHFVDTYKIPINHKIIEIIRNKKHLIYKSEIPECFYKYLDYTLGWELLDNQKRNNVPNYYEYYYCFNFPQEFRNYINNTLDLLLRRKQELLGATEMDSTAY